MKSGSLKLLEPSGLHRACYGTALPLHLRSHIIYSYIIIQFPVLLINSFPTKPDSNSHWHHVLLLQRPFSIIYFDYINYFHNYDQNIKSRCLFQLQMVLGMTMMKCCVSVECQLKGKVLILIFGVWVCPSSLWTDTCVFFHVSDVGLPAIHCLNRCFWFSSSFPDRG